MSTLVLSTVKADTWQNKAGTQEFYKCQAWVNFNGTGTVAIRASGNVSSISDNGVGDYTINFTTAMPDANYSWAGATTGNGDGYILESTSSTRTANGVRIITRTSSALIDATQNSISIFR